MRGTRKPSLAPCWFAWIAAGIGLAASPSGAQVVNFNFASVSNNASAVFNGEPGEPAPRGANTFIGDGPGNSARWNNRLGAVWTNTLAPEAQGSPVRSVRVYDRSCCTAVAPYDFLLLDSTGAVLWSTNYTTALSRPATFAIPDLTNVNRVVLRHTGAVAGDMFLGEAEVIGFNTHVGGKNVIGTLSMTSSVSGASSTGFVDNVRIALLELTETTGSVDLNTGEFQVFGTNGVNVALQSQGGAAFLRDYTRGFGMRGRTTVKSSHAIADINDGDTSTFSDSGADTYYFIQFPAATTISNVVHINRIGCCGGQGNMRLRLYSGTSIDEPIYDTPVFVSRVNGATTVLPFVRGGVASASMADGETYRFELDATAKTNDVIRVVPMQADSTSLGVDGKLVVTIKTGTPAPDDRYHLLAANAFTGAFDSMDLPADPCPGCTWNTGQLLTQGMLIVKGPPAGSLILVR